MSAADFFTEIQQAVINRLDPDATFDGIPLLHENMDNFDQAFDIVFGKANIIGVVRTPFGNITAANLPAVRFDDIPVEIEFWENTVFNRATANTNPRTVMDLALAALGLLVLKFPRNTSDEIIANALYADNPTLVNLGPTVDQERFPNVQGVLVRLKTGAGFNFTPTATLLDGNNQTLLDGMGLPLLTPRPVLT